MYYGVFSKKLTSRIKKAGRIICEIVPNDGIYLLLDDVLLIKMTGSDYDAIARPATFRDPGNWEKYPGRTEEYQDRPNDGLAKRLFDQAVEKSDCELTAVSMMAHFPDKKPDYIDLFYGAERGIVSGVPERDIEAFAVEIKLKSSGDNQFPVAYCGDAPTAVFSPVRLDDKIKAAVKAYCD